MIRLLAVVLTLTGWLLPTAAAAQTAASHADAHRAWVFFRDRAGAERVPATPEAEARRARRATSGDSLDYGVSMRYVQALEQRGFAVETTSRFLNAAVVTVTDDEARGLQTLPFVRGLRPVASGRTARLTHTFEAPEAAGPLATFVDPAPEAASLLADCGTSCTQLTTVNAVAALDRGYNGTGVTLGIIDTEFGSFAHTAFADLVASGRLKGYQNYTIGSQTDRHGQACASQMIGYAAGNLIGPGYGASLYAATTEYAPTETNKEETDFVTALEWMEAQGVDAVSVSLGYTTFDTGQRSYTYANLNGDTGVTTRAADAAAERGMLVVAAAGNEGCSSPTGCWYYIGTPADGDSVLAVGAVSSSKVKASFSSFGPTADGRTKPDVAAQGVSNRYASGATGYSSGSGTSYATPIVSGVVAMLLQANPNLRPMDVRQILRETASQATAPDNSLGWGVIDADAAVTRALTFVANDPDARPADGPAVRVARSTFTGEMLLFVRGTGAARAVVYDVLGRPVADLFDGTLGAAEERLALPRLAPGVYVYRVTADGGAASGTVVVR